VSTTAVSTCEVPRIGLSADRAQQAAKPAVAGLPTPRRLSLDDPPVEPLYKQLGKLAPSESAAPWAPSSRASGCSGSATAGAAYAAQDNAAPAAIVNAAAAATVVLVAGDVSSLEGVSFHLPLHRSLAALLREAAATPYAAAGAGGGGGPRLHLGQLVDEILRCELRRTAEDEAARLAAEAAAKEAAEARGSSPTAESPPLLAPDSPPNGGWDDSPLLPAALPPRTRRLPPAAVYWSSVESTPELSRAAFSFHLPDSPPQPAGGGGFVAPHVALNPADARRRLLLRLVEHPLRVLTLSAQVGAHLWRRNGAEMLSQVLNYTVAPHCIKLRDLDLTIVQFVAAALSGSPLDLLLTLLHRFRLYGWALRATAASNAPAAAAAAAAVRAAPSSERSLLGVGRARRATDRAAADAANSDSDSSCDGAPSHSPPSSQPETGDWRSLGRLESLLHCDSAQRLRLVGEALQLLIQIVTALPPPPPPLAATPGNGSVSSNSAFSAARDPARATLRRELIQRLATAPATRSEAIRLIDLVPRPADAKRLADDVDALLQEVAIRVAAPPNPGGGSPLGLRGGGARFKLKDELWAEVDPEHAHTALHFLRLSANTGATDGAGAGGAGLPPPAPPARLGGEGGGRVPLVGPPPPAHPYFARARRLLHEPVLVCLLRSALATGATNEVRSRAVQLLTLAVHTLDDDLEAEEDPTIPAADSPAPRRRRRRHTAFFAALAAPAPSADALKILPPPPVHTQLAAPPLRARRPERTGAANAAAADGLAPPVGAAAAPDLPRARALPPQEHEEAACAIAAQPGKSHSSVVGLLQRIASQGRGSSASGEGGSGGGGGSADDGAVLRSACAWLVHMLALRDDGCARVVKETAASAATAAAVTAGPASSLGAAEPSVDSAAEAAQAKRQTAKTAARRRALAQMSRQAQSFAALMQVEDGGAQPESPLGQPSSRDASPSSSHVSPSQLRRGSGLPPAFELEDREALAAAEAAEAELEEQAEDEALTCIICHVGDADSAGPMGRIGFMQPSATLCCAREPRQPNGSAAQAEGCSWAASAADALAAAPAAARRRGGVSRALHVGFCGHVVHLECFDSHAGFVRSRAERGIQIEVRSAADPSHGEFLCPLCKRLSNLLLPHLPLTPADADLARRVLLTPPASAADSLPPIGQESAVPVTVGAETLAVRAALAPFLPPSDVRRHWTGFALSPVTAEAPSPWETEAAATSHGRLALRLCRLSERFREVRRVAQAETASAALGSPVGQRLATQAPFSRLSPTARAALAALAAGGEWLCAQADALLRPEAAAALLSAGPEAAAADALTPLVGCFHAAAAQCRIVLASLPPLASGSQSDAEPPAFAALRRALGALDWAVTGLLSGALPPWRGPAALELRWLLELLPPTAAAAAATHAGAIEPEEAALPWERGGGGWTAARPRRLSLSASATAELAEAAGRPHDPRAWPRSLSWGAAAPSAWGGQPALCASQRRGLALALRSVARLCAPHVAADLDADQPAGGLLSPGAGALGAAAAALPGPVGSADGAPGAGDGAPDPLGDDVDSVLAAGADGAHGVRVWVEGLWRAIAFTVAAEADADERAAADGAAWAANHAAISAAQDGAATGADASRQAQLRPLVRAALQAPLLFARPEDATEFAAAPLARLIAFGAAEPAAAPALLFYSTTAGAEAGRTSPATATPAEGGAVLDHGALAALRGDGGSEAVPRPGCDAIRLRVVKIRRVSQHTGSAPASPAPQPPPQPQPQPAETGAAEAPPPTLDAANPGDGAAAAAAAGAAGARLAAGAAAAPESALAPRRYELVLSDGEGTVEARLAPHLSWLVDSNRVRPRRAVVLTDWFFDGDTLVATHLEPHPLAPPSSTHHTAAAPRSASLFSAPLLLAPPRQLLTAALLSAADAAQAAHLITLLGLAALARALLLSCRQGRAAAAGDERDGEVWTVLPTAVRASAPAAAGCGWPVRAAPADEAPVLCWLPPGSSVRAVAGDSSAPPALRGWMRVRLAGDGASDAVSAAGGVLGSGAAAGGSGASGSPCCAASSSAPGAGLWTRMEADVEAPADCRLVCDVESSAAAPLLALRDALFLGASADAPRGTALVALVELELRAFHRMATALLRLLLPRPAHAAALAAPLGEGASWRAVLASLGAPAAEDLLASPKLLRTMGRWAGVADAALRAADVDSAAHRPLAGPAAGAPPPPPATTRLASAGGAARLWQLPSLYTDLYASAAFRAHRCPVTGKPPEEPAICLVCGAVLCGGSACCKRSGVGALTRHACGECGEGIGLFFLVHKCQTVLLRGPHAAYWSSPFLDDFGEEDSGLRRGRPLRLDAARMASLHQLWTRHAVAAEVVRERSVRDRVIRDNYW